MDGRGLGAGRGDDPALVDLGRFTASLKVAWSASEGRDASASLQAAQAADATHGTCGRVDGDLSDRLDCANACSGGGLSHRRCGRLGGHGHGGGACRAISGSPVGLTSWSHVRVWNLVPSGRRHRSPAR